MKTFKLFLKWLKGNRLSFTLAIILLVLLDYVRSLVPIFISQLFVVIAPDKNETALPGFLQKMFINKTTSTQLIVVAVAIFVVIITRDILNFLYDFQINFTSENVGRRIQARFYEHVQDLPYAYLNKTETGDLIQRSTQDISKFKRFIGGTLTNMLNSIMLIIFYFYQMARINIQYALLSVVCIPLLILTSLLFFKKIQPQFKKIEEIESKVTTVAQENFTNIRVVKAFANEKFETEKYHKAVSEYTGTWKKTNKVLSFFWASTDVLAVIQIIATFGLGVYFMNHGLTFSQVTVMFLCTNNILWPARSLGRQLSDLSKSDIASQRIMEILNQPTEYVNDGKLTPNISGNIRFENVSFTFSDAKIATLEEINLDIKRGETIAIIGRTGSGKSTMLNLLNRTLETSGGKIYFDDIEIKDISKKYLRKQIGFVMQEPFLYSRTVKENIGVQLDNIDDNIVKNAASTAMIDRDIEKFTQGYETIVGERGITLSGGQKQRVAIARILTNDKPILVFDDSLSAVDSETDKKIRSALNNRDKQTTTIIITHRVVTAMNADKIVILDKGKISEIGTHEELKNREGLYKTIWEIQTKFNVVPLKAGE